MANSTQVFSRNELNLYLSRRHGVTIVELTWDPVHKSHEWTIAKQKLSDSNGIPLANGSKLSRKSSGFSHSFMVIDNTILALDGQGKYLGEGVSGKVKLAEDEAGNLFALKIMKSTSSWEADIANDLNIAGREVSRMGGKKASLKKHYIAYKYLGVTLFDYYTKFAKTLSLDARYDLCIKISLALHALHTGELSQTKTSYIHGDLHQGNIVIDKDGNPHIIDFGKTRKTNLTDVTRLANEDTQRIFAYFYTPAQHRKGEPFSGIFGNILPDYEFRFGSGILEEQQLSLDLANPDENGMYTDLTYTVLDSKGSSKDRLGQSTSIVTIPLTQLGIKPIDPAYSFDRANYQDTEKQLMLRKDQILHIAINNGHIADIFQNRNEILFQIFNNSDATALEMAEALTVCRFNLEDHLPMLMRLSSDERLECIQLLNSHSKMIFELYHQIRASYNTEKPNLEREIKTVLINQVITQQTQSSAIDTLNQLLPDQNEATSLIRERLSNLIQHIDKAKTWTAHQKPYTSEDAISNALNQQTEIKSKLKDYVASVSTEGNRLKNTSNSNVATQSTSSICQAIKKSNTENNSDSNDDPKNSSKPGGSSIM